MAFNRNHTHAAKLTPSQVMEIRRLYATEGWTQSRLSRHFQVTVGQIGRIVRGESWQQYGQIRHDQELEFAAVDGSTPPALTEAEVLQNPEFQAFMERMQKGELDADKPITALPPMKVSVEDEARYKIFGVAPPSKPAIQAQMEAEEALPGIANRQPPLDPPGTGLAGHSSEVTERGLVGSSEMGVVDDAPFNAQHPRAMHSVTCLNVDILDPQGAFKNAAECPCQHENPLAGGLGK